MKTTYQQAKEQLKRIANNAKKAHANDKPMTRQIINDSAYELSKVFKLSEYQYNLLCNYACELHSN